MTDIQALREQVQEAHDAEVSYSPMDWIYFLVSIVFQILLLMFVPNFAWVALPFWFTFLFKALRQI